MKTSDFTEGVVTHPPIRSLGRLLRSGGPRAAWALALSALLMGCAGSMVLSDNYQGLCSTQNVECRQQRCEGLVDVYDCEMLCDYEARLCQRGQQGDVTAARRLGDNQAMIIDLSEPKPMHSSTIALALSPEAVSIPGAYTLPPGAHLKATLKLPAHITRLELHVAHAPGGDGTSCFVTATVGDKTLWGRYSPPRMGANLLKREVFDLSRMVEKSEQPQEVTLFLYNNASAGSTRPYTLASLEFFYRALEPRK